MSEESYGFSWFPCSPAEIIKKANEKLKEIQDVRRKEDEETIEELVKKYNRFCLKPWYWFINLFLKEKYTPNKETIKIWIDNKVYLAAKYGHGFYGDEDLWNYPSSACWHQEALVTRLKNFATEASMLGQKEIMITENDWNLIS